MAAEEIITVFKAEVEGYKKSLSEVKLSLTDLEKKVGDAQKTSTSSFAKMSTDGAAFKQTLLDIGSALGVAFSVGAVVNFGRESIRAFQEAEVNAKKLEFAVRSLAGGSGSAFQKLLEQATQLQKISIFSDDDIQQAQTMLLQFGLTTDQVEKLIPKILDLASATGDDLGSATQKSIQAINGQTRGLKSVGIQFEDTGSKTQNLSILTDQLTKFQGSMAASLETSAGKTENLKNAFSDFMESVGEDLVNSGEGILNFLEDISISIFGNEAMKATKEMRENTKHYQKASIEDRKALQDELSKLDKKQLESRIDFEKKWQQQYKEGKNGMTADDLRYSKDALKVAQDLYDSQDKIHNDHTSKFTTKTAETLKTNEELWEEAKKEIGWNDEDTEVKLRGVEYYYEKYTELSEEQLAKMLELHEIDDVTYEEVINRKMALDEKYNEQFKEGLNTLEKNKNQYYENMAIVDEAYTDLELENQRLVREGALLGAEIFKQVFKEEAVFQSAALVFEKLIAIAEIIQKLQIEKAGYWAKYSLLPGGEALAKAASTTANIRAGISIATIAAQTIPQLKFAEGTKSVEGGIKGRDSVSALLMPEEMVIPVKTKKKYEPLLNAIFDHRISTAQANAIAKAGTKGTTGENMVNNYSLNGIRYDEIANAGKWANKEVVREIRSLRRDIKQGVSSKLARRYGA